MKNISIILILSLSIILSGCGKEKIEDVAVNYMKFVSEGKLSDAKEILAPDNKELITAVKRCKKEDVLKIIESTKKIMSIHFNRHGGFKGDYLEEYREKIKSKNNGSFLGVSHETQKKISDEIINKIAKGDRDIINIINSYRTGDPYGVSDNAANAVYNKINELPEYCALPEFASLKVIHVDKNKDGDIATAKIEGVFKDGKSKKYELHLEKIQDEWKIIGGLLGEFSRS